MQGRERADRELLDAAALAGHLVPAGSMFAFLAGHRAEVFPDSEYADLFAPPGVGRPSLPATQMAAVLALQVLHDFPDRETAESVRFDVRWKVAIGTALDNAGFDASSLVYWRKRIAKPARPHRVNDAVRAIAEQTGVLAGRRRRVADSTIVADAVATRDTITQLVAAVRKVGREVPGAAEQIAAVCTGHDYSAPGRPKIDWGDPAARQQLLSALVNDANAVVAAVNGPGLGPGPAEAVALLALIAGQDVEPAEGSDGTDGRWRITPRPEDKGHGTTAPDRVISVTGPQARHARKRLHDRTDGYRVHLAAEPSTGIITDEELTMAAGEDNSDAAAAARFVARAHPPAAAGADAAAAGADAADAAADADAAGAPAADAPSCAAPAGSGAGDPGELAWYGGTAYGTGELRQVIAGAGDTAIIKPKALRTPAFPGRFTIDDFTPDEDAGTLTCPAGITRQIPPGRAVTFGVACRHCPLRERCSTSASGKSVTLHPRDSLLRAARHAWASDKDLRKDYRTTRPHIERAIAQVATHRGRRIKLRYRGTAKNHAWLKNRTAAINLRNLIGKGLHHTATGWALTT